MSDEKIKPKTIREYLLGRISDEELLIKIEDLLFTDDEFCTGLELAEDKLINEYTFGKLTLEDTKSFEAKIKNNPDLKLKTILTQSLKEKAKEQKLEEKTSFFDLIKIFINKPLYSGAFALLIIAVLFSLYFLILQTPSEIAQLQKIYQTERPLETRISNFGYAPFVTLRSEQINEENKNKLDLIEKNLLEAVVTNSNAKNRHALGVFYLTQKKYEDSIRELKKATELDETNARFHNDLGSAHFELAKNGSEEKRSENTNSANEEFSKAIELNENLLEAIFNKSLTLEKLNLRDGAKESWKQYLKKDSNSKWAEEARKRLKNLNEIESTEKTKEEILEGFLEAYRAKDYQKAIQIHNETKGTFKHDSVLFQLTNRYLLAKKEPDPEKEEEAIEALKYIGKVEKEYHSDFFVSDLAEFYIDIDEKKIEDLLKAQKLIIEGYGLHTKSKAKQAIEKFEQSKKIYLENGNKIESNIAEIWIVQVLPSIGKIEKSRMRLNSLIKVAEKHNYKILIPTTLYWLSALSFQQNKFSDGFKIMKESLLLAEETDNFFEIQHSSSGLITYYNYFGEPENSLNYVVQATGKRDAYYLNTAQLFRNLSSIANLNSRMGNKSSYVDFAKESLWLSRRILPETEAVNNLSKTQAINSSLRILTNAFAKKKNYKEALRYAIESNKIALNKEKSSQNDRLIAETFLTLADLKSEMQNCIDALDDYEKSLNFYRTTSEITYNLYNIQKGKLLCFWKLKSQLKFQIQLKKVLETSEKYRQEIREDETRQSFFDNQQIVFDLAISDTLKKNDKQKAFEFAEMSKARSLLDFIRSEKSISQTETEDLSVTKPLSIEEIQNLMPENVQIVQYALLEGNLATWVLTKKKFDLVEKEIVNSDLQKTIEKYHKSIIEKENNENIKQNAQFLYELLIPKNLEKDKVVCFILDKSLHQIPFASLVSTQNRYLIEDFAILYSPSASVFVIASEKAENKSNTDEENLLSIGNPQFDRTDNPNLKNLPNAEIEAKRITENYRNSNVLIGQNATKENFIKQFEKAEVIHYAGHFVVNGQTPRNSKFVFADDNLHSFEFSDKKLPASKLVVLSACQTAYEKLNNSEGAIGIGRTFLALGTPVVIASNWRVESESTKDLMVLFHKNRREKNLSSVESLRLAQVELLKNEKTQSPYFWAAFSSIGGFARY